jgi:hypothetical protein
MAVLASARSVASDLAVSRTSFRVASIGCRTANCVGCSWAGAAGRRILGTDESERGGLAMIGSGETQIMMDAQIAR